MTIKHQDSSGFIENLYFDTDENRLNEFHHICLLFPRSRLVTAGKSCILFLYNEEQWPPLYRQAAE